MSYRPLIFRQHIKDERIEFEQLQVNQNVAVRDRIEAQLADLLLCRNPSMNESDVLSKNLVAEFLAEQECTLSTYGNWVYYPWKNLAIRVLPEDEFIEVRTNRNKFKITDEEQRLLSNKSIGIAGLSVGRTIATTIALERIAGEIRLADFDSIELSNLNRLKVPLAEMGENKAISAAREIAEIDPYLRVKCYTEGLTDENMDDFLTAGGKLDLFVEECDDIGIKIQSRLMCKELQIPVIMETNDNCVIDIERFDLEAERPIFHGKLSDNDIQFGLEAKTMGEKIAILSKLLDVKNISQGLLISLPEMGKTVRSWPQLGGDVVYGAGVVSSLARNIFLNKTKGSGQFVYKLQNI